MQDYLSTLERLDNEECLKTYTASSLESKWRNVLVVSKVETDDSLISMWLHSPIEGYADDHWVCHGQISSTNGVTWAGSRCDVQEILVDPASWTIPRIEYCSSIEDQSFGTCQVFSTKVDYCLAERFEAPCTIRVSIYLLAVIIVRNAAKTVCLVATAISRGSSPLCNIGDAIASFLREPVENTRNCGTLTVSDVRAGLKTALPKPFVRRRRRWIRAVSTRRWISCVIMYEFCPI